MMKHIILTIAVLLLSTVTAYAEHAVKYTCPMHPQIIEDKPGTCPICGMTLVPIDAGAHNHNITAPDEKPIITIESGTIQTMGVRTQPVSRENGILYIPNSAILRSSEGGHVIVALGNGRFQGRDVTIGNISYSNTQIISGLTEGENIVTRAQFMIDAESNLREALEKFQGGEHAGH